VNPNPLIAVVCGVIALALLIISIRELLVWCYKEGYQRGRKDAEEAWTKLGAEVDQARQQIWREEGTKQ
jgi:hypothetical protein